MQQITANCSLSQFLPKFSQQSKQLTQPYSNNILVRNLLIYTKYKRRQKAIKDLSNIYTYFYQVTQQFTQYSVQQNPQLLSRQLEYLHALNLEQFNTNIQLVILAVYKLHLELLLAMLKINSCIKYSYQSIEKLFLKKGIITLLYIITGNQIYITIISKLLDILFSQDNKRECKGQVSLLFYLIL